MNFLKRILGKTNFPMLGRWSILYDPKIINTKVDQANEDHCGCCAEVVINPKQKPIKKDEYYRPFLV